MRITATPIRAADLKPGDLFSTRGPNYWRSPTAPYIGGWTLSRDPAAIGEKVYIRTEAPCPAGQENVAVYRIELKP